MNKSTLNRKLLSYRNHSTVSFKKMCELNNILESMGFCDFHITTEPNGSSLNLSHEIGEWPINNDDFVLNILFSGKTQGEIILELNRKYRGTA